MQGIAPLPSTQSEHDFHKFGIHPNSVAPGFHFHLAASINPDTGMIKCSMKYGLISMQKKKKQKMGLSQNNFFASGVILRTDIFL